MKAQTKTQHTPTPWKLKPEHAGQIARVIIEGEIKVGIVYTKEHAETIVKAVNSHYELLDSLKYIEYAAEGIDVQNHGNEDAVQITITVEALRQLKQAIQNAQ